MMSTLFSWRRSTIRLRRLLPFPTSPTNTPFAVTLCSAFWMSRGSDWTRWMQMIYPGEDEMLAMAQGALRVLRGEEEAKDY